MAQNQTKIYTEQGGATMHVEDGGTIVIATGGQLQMDDATLVLASADAITITAGGAITIETGATVAIESGGNINIEPGAELQFDGTAMAPAADPADLALTASATYDQTEVQSIADKLDDLLDALRTAGLLV